MPLALGFDELFPGCFVTSMIALVALGIIFGRAVTLGSGKGARRYKKVSDLVREVSAITGLPGHGPPDSQGFIPELAKISFAGKLAGGRQGRVLFHAVTVGSSTTTYVRLAVDADDAPDLKVSLESLATRFKKFAGLVTEIEIGHEAFDRKYLLETEHPGRARSLLAQDRELRTAIDDLFAFGGSPVLTLGKGVFSYEATVSELNPGDYSRVLAGLDRLASFFDRVKLEVKVLGKTGRAIADRSGKTRCPYCRAAIQGDDESLTACSRCSTVLHEACWNEHGGCPILGCPGSRPASRRVRVG